MTRALIELERVSYSYGPRIALDDVSLEVAAGEYVVVLGRNGGGKTTLARHLNGLLVPDRGRVVVEGLDTRDPEERRKVRDVVGMVFQQPAQQIVATVVEDDVAWALAERGLPGPVIRERVERAMEAVGIADLRDLPPHKLSGGQQQRVAIAGVLALRPRAIVADEATAMLDPLSRLEVVRLLHALRRRYGLAIVQVTHLLEEVALADRVAVVDGGRLVMDGPPEEVLWDLERLRQLGLAVPEQVELAARLRSAGLPLSPDSLTVEALARGIAR